MVVKFTAELPLAAREGLSQKKQRIMMSNSRGGQTTRKGNQIEPKQGLVRAKGY